MVSYKQVLLTVLYTDGSSNQYPIIHNPTTKKLVVCGPIGSSDPLTEQDMALYPTGEIELNEVSSGQQPVSGKHTVYFKTDGKMYRKDDGGTEVEIASGASGDVTGPGSAVDGNFASFNGVTGKVIADSGSKPADFAQATHGSTHQNDGADEISVAGLSGVLADAQVPQSHDKTKHDGSVFTGTASRPETLGANYMDIDAMTAPATPGSGTRRVYVDGTSLKLTAKKSDGSTVGLEGEGDVAGPASSVAGDIPTFTDVSGKVLQDSGAKLTDFAPSSKGVTNGDSHDHSGGDGAQISHSNLSDIGTNAHSAIDTFISSKAQASGLASLNASSKVVQDPANATATPAESKIPIAGVGGTLNSGWIPDLSGTYAPVSKGVTNGDSHNHVGGDGAQIDHTGLSNIGTNAHSVIDTHLGASAPHSGHEQTANKGANSGYCGLDSGGLVDASDLPNIAVTKEIMWVLFNDNASAVVGDGIEGKPIPAGWNGKSIVTARLTCSTVGATGTTDMQVRIIRASDGSSVDVLSTKVTMAGERSCADGTIKSDGSQIVYTGDRVYPDIDAVETTAPKGLSAVVEIR